MFDIEMNLNTLFLNYLFKRCCSGLPSSRSKTSSHSPQMQLLSFKNNIQSSLHRRIEKNKAQSECEKITLCPVSPMFKATLMFQTTTQTTDQSIQSILENQRGKQNNQLLRSAERKINTKIWIKIQIFNQSNHIKIKSTKFLNLTLMMIISQSGPMLRKIQEKILSRKILWGRTELEKLMYSSIIITIKRMTKALRVRKKCIILKKSQRFRLSDWTKMLNQQFSL